MRIPIIKIGTSRSGNTVCIFVTDDEAYIQNQLGNLSAVEHFDAWAIFERLTAREFRRDGFKTHHFSKYEWYAKKHQAHMTEHFITVEMARLGFRTSLDLLRFAAELTEEVFLD